MPVILQSQLLFTLLCEGKSRLFFFCAGFTRSDPKNIKECLRAGGICFPIGCPFSKRIGRCSPGVRCCKKKVSLGFYTADITV
uniref:Beta-defensin-like domain-containing protein n=1 Tax=Terrapene triunguis TaxID=2587831 RepID=A0A674IZU4_9SAUR